MQQITSSEHLRDSTKVMNMHLSFVRLAGMCLISSLKTEHLFSAAVAFIVLLM